jgi:hypothetical protein
MSRRSSSERLRKRSFLVYTKWSLQVLIGSALERRRAFSSLHLTDHV